MNRQAAGPIEVHGQPCGPGEVVGRAGGDHGHGDTGPGRLLGRGSHAAVTARHHDPVGAPRRPGQLAGILHRRDPGGQGSQPVLQVLRIGAPPEVEFAHSTSAGPALTA